MTGYGSPRADHPGRVLLGLSGGVFSAVTGALLKTQGYELFCAYVDIGCPESLCHGAARCAEKNGKEQAAKNAAKLGAQLHVIDGRGLFEERVLEYTVHELAQGRAPHPCVPCHSSVRIEALLREAAQLRCDAVATGHAARVQRDPRTGVSQLFKGSDPKRDHSFFLFSLSQLVLGRLELPLGNFPRAMIERLAVEVELEVLPEPEVGEDQRQSLVGAIQETECLVGNPEFSDYFDKHAPKIFSPRGVVRLQTGQTLGPHDGVHRYRIGTRTTLDFMNEENSNLVMIGREPKTGNLVAGTIDMLSRSEVTANGVNWLRPQPLLKGVRCFVRLEPRGESCPALVTAFENATAHVQFEKPFGPVVAGQPVVFYGDDEVLGGGWILTGASPR